MQAPPDRYARNRAQLLTAAVVILLAGLGVWRAATLYSNRDSGPAVDPRERSMVITVLERALRGDSAGVLSAGAGKSATLWALAAARGDSAMVRGWTRTAETDIVGRAGDTVSRTWFTTAALQRCAGAAALRARFVERGNAIKLIDLQSPCSTVAPITFAIPGEGSK